MPVESYKVRRFFQRDARNARTIKTRLTLEEAQAHCRDPETSSSTATSAKAKRYTALHGPWFDGYDKEEPKRHRTLKHWLPGGLMSKERSRG